MAHPKFLHPYHVATLMFRGASVEVRFWACKDYGPGHQLLPSSACRDAIAAELFDIAFDVQCPDSDRRWFDQFRTALAARDPAFRVVA